MENANLKFQIKKLAPIFKIFTKKIKKQKET